MDEERIEALGWEPLRAELASVSGLTDIPAFLHALGAFERTGVGGFFGAFVDNDPGDPERYLVFLEQAGLGLPDESYYREERFAPVREAFVAHIQRMLELAGLDDAAARAQRVFDLETAIAAQ